MSQKTHNLLQGGRFAHVFSTIRPTFIWIKNFVSIIPTRSALRRFRSGTRPGKLARHIFEHQQINKILGTNLAMAALATSMLNIPNLTKTTYEEIPAPAVIKTETLAFATQKGVRLPTQERKLTQGFTIFHPGVDLDGITGDPIWPIMNGKVEAASYSRFSYGNAIIVDHGNGLTSLYAHLSKINVVQGQDVTTDTVIGLMGATGNASGDHLHLEVRDHGSAVNPLSILPR